ncbi:MAG TPA: helix-turn-helix transcriptional regulator [Kofleriaceae bacterium]
MSGIDTAELLPLTPASFHILLVLAAGPAHGYAIMQEVTRMTEGVSQLGSGTLYRTIQKLVEDDLIHPMSADHDDERRVPYRMTKRGDAVARAEAARLAVLLRVAEKRRLISLKPAGRAARGAHA